MPVPDSRSTSGTTNRTSKQGKPGRTPEHTAATAGQRAMSVDFQSETSEVQFPPVFISYSGILMSIGRSHKLKVDYGHKPAISGRNSSGFISGLAHRLDPRAWRRSGCGTGGRNF